MCQVLAIGARPAKPHGFQRRCAARLGRAGRPSLVLAGTYHRDVTSGEVRRWIGPVDGDQLRPLRLGLSLLGLLFLLASFIPNHGFDLYAYWVVHVDPYAPVIDDINGYGAFRYAPPIAMLMAPLGLLPWPAVVVGWLALQLAALWYIGRGWALALVVFPPVWLDIVYGNINILLAAMIVASFRQPAVWSFGLLTKVTPGVGLIWLAVRREWRALVVTIGVTAALSAAAVAIMGTGPWTDWAEIVLNRSGVSIPPDALPIPLLPRLVVAVAIIAWAAHTGRRWLVPIAVVCAMPLLWAIAFAPLVACWALVPPATAARIHDAIAGWSLRETATRR